MSTHHPKSLEELKQTRKPLRDVNQVHRQKMTQLQKLALWITVHVGSMGFFFIIFAWTLLWLGWNTLAPKTLRYDPYPAFVFWLFISNMLQIFLMPLIMIGQNVQSDHAELRAEADFEVNTKAELEVETILMHLENQNQLLQLILKKLEKEDTTPQ